MSRPKDDGAANRTSKPDVMEDVDPEKMRFINGSEEIYPNDNVTVKIPDEKEIDAATFSGLTKQELMVFADDPFWTKIRNVLMLVFWVFWFGMLISAVLIIIFTPGCPVEPQMTWLQEAKVYQIFPRSFLDTDHDGIGDIKGITEKIGYLHDDLSVTAVWVNPFFPSKMRGAGYDIMNHTAIDERYGTMQDFDNLVKKLHKNDMRLIIDFVPNHTSKKHKWFQESRKSKKNSYANYYIWHPGYKQGSVRQPPNNWRSVYGGSAWTFDNTRGEFYLHQFFSDQPDLNLRNKEVIANLQKTLEFWMKKGVDAFHLANADFLVESKDLDLNEVVVNVAVNNTEAYEDMYHNLTKYQPDTFELVGEWAKIVASHPSDKTEPFLILESDGDDKVMQMYKEQARVGGKTGIHIKIDRYLTELDSQCLGRCIYKTITSIIAKEKDALWPMWMVGDKYSSRVASRMGSEYVNAMNMLLMTLRGTPITYYGEEIGMIDLNLTAVNLSNYNLVGSAVQLNTKQLNYDECRAPMQWTALKNAGFTEGRHTWRPIGSNYLTANVRTQKAHGIGVSHVEVYRVLSNLRPKPAIRFGHFSPIGLHESVFCFVRHYPRFKSYLIAINFGPHEATLNFFAASPDLVQAEGEVVATTHNFKVPGEFKFGDRISLSNVYLRPTEGIVIEMEAQ